MSLVQSSKKQISVHGVVLLDKPAGLSSNDALIRIKRKLNAKKAGHTGTLDPFATGLLPLCFGEATKFSQDLLNADKTYETTIQLGIKTLTGDTEGEIIEQKPVDHLTIEKIEGVLKQFIGEIDQVPPMYSALKRHGKPLYEYARAGIEIERQARKIVVNEIEILDFSNPYLTLKISCGKGTYIRVLGEDIGTALKSCAHLKALRRVKIGAFNIDDATMLTDIEQAESPYTNMILKPVDYLLSTFPSVELSAELSRRFLHGQRLSLEKEKLPIFEVSERVRVYNADTKKLLGTALIKDNRILAPERLISS